MSGASFIFIGAPFIFIGASLSLAGAPLHLAGAPLHLAGASLLLAGASLHLAGAQVSLAGAQVLLAGASFIFIGAPASSTFSFFIEVLLQMAYFHTACVFHFFASQYQLLVRVFIWFPTNGECGYINIHHFPVLLGIAKLKTIHANTRQRLCVTLCRKKFLK